MSNNNNNGTRWVYRRYYDYECTIIYNIPFGVHVLSVSTGDSHGNSLYPAYLSHIVQY